METIDAAAAFRAAADAQHGLSGSVLSRSIVTAVEALRVVPTDVSDYRALDEPTLLALNTLTAEAARLAGAHAVLLAGEIARRSAPELGSQGLAQRSGHRTAEHLVKITTGTSGRAATTAVRTGILLGQMADEGSIDQVTGEVAAPAQPWLRDVSAAVREGALSVEAADAISFWLGSPNSAVTTEQLASLATELVTTARVRPDGTAGLDVDQLVKLTRMRREELDLDGVQLREDEQHAARGIRLVELPSGMGRLILDLDPESLAVAKQLLHRAVSPKLKTVRFFDPTDKSKAERILADERTPAQLGFDAFMQLLLLGADSNPDVLLGTGAPQIRVTTTLKALEAGEGIVRVEDSTLLFSMRTLKRLQCTGGITTILFDEHLHPLDVGREQRLFTSRQRIALATKWGGCVAPGCTAPVSFTEAHHVEEWQADHGNTDIADGILLCKHHHLLFHNNGWHIHRDAHGRYWLTPPPTVDPGRTPIRLHPKTRNMHDLQPEARDANDSGAENDSRTEPQRAEPQLEFSRE